MSGKPGPPRFCTIEGCGRRHKAKGLCHTHHQNARNAGTYAIVARADREMYDALAAYAKRHSMTKAEVLRTFIEWGLENDDALGVQDHHDLIRPRGSPQQPGS